MANADINLNMVQVNNTILSLPTVDFSKYWHKSGIQSIACCVLLCDRLVAARTSAGAESLEIKSVPNSPAVVRDLSIPLCLYDSVR